MRAGVSGIVALLLLLVVLVIGYSSLFTVRETEQVLLVRLGEPVRVVSEKTADTVLAMMESVVSEGTGSLAAIPGYRVAGKTGTAQAANPHTGKLDHFVASFNGVAPADDPRVAVSVVLYYPELQYGGVVAAPVFSDVTAFALQHLGVEPNDSKPKTFPLEW